MAANLNIWLQNKLERKLSSRTLQRIERLGLEHRIAKTDPFGFSPDSIRKVLPFVAWLYESYFRVDMKGIESLPSGRVLLVANHSGQIPIDGVMIAASLLLEQENPRALRSMVERWVPGLPFLSTVFARLGQVLGTPENCMYLLERDEAVLVFPEGAKGISKTIDKAYQLQDFGHGFMRLAMQTNTPIVPVGVVGAEEQYPAMWNLERLARVLNMPALPISPTFFVPVVGLLPLPVKYRIRFGEPIYFQGDPDEDEALVEQRVRQVKDAIAELLDSGLNDRKGIFF